MIYLLPERKEVKGAMVTNFEVILGRSAGSIGSNFGYVSEVHLNKGGPAY